MINPERTKKKSTPKYPNSKIPENGKGPTNAVVAVAA
jgi:hypothetical protein